MGSLFSTRRRSPSQAVDATQIDATVNTPTGPAVGVPVVSGVVNVAPTASTTAWSLRAVAEKSLLAHGSSHTLLTMCSLKAPSAPEDANAARAPLDLVCCIDKSGSMRGEKMQLMKNTLELLVKRTGLRPSDRVAFVTFDSKVTVDLPLTAMDGAGRSRAEDVVKKIQPGSTTNLSGGALKAIDIFASDSGRPTAGAAATRAVLLFTDGLATDGIRDTPRLVAAVEGALSQASQRGPISLFNFGFGADHSEELLKALAQGSGAGGQYYFVNNADDIPNAFADCLGGLVSIVGQNAKLNISPLEGAIISRILGSTYTRAADGSIELGDMFSEDEKDLLIELSLPALPKPAGPAPVMRATLRAFDVARATTIEETVTLEVSRPETTPADQPVNAHLDEQKNRILVAEAMEAASRAADRGDLAEGRALLGAAKLKVAASATGGLALSSALQNECAELEINYATMGQYRSVGSKMSKMQAMSHSRQRANHLSAGVYKGAASKKMAMKASWMSSMKKEERDSDSDDACEVGCEAAQSLA